MSAEGAKGRSAGRVFAAAPDELSDIRRWVRDAARRCELPGPQIDDLVLVASELVANAVEASRPGHRIAIELVVAGDRSTTLVVENVGRAFEPSPQAELPDPTSERGRGLAIVELLGHEVRSEHGDGYTRVIAHRG